MRIIRLFLLSIGLLFTSVPSLFANLAFDFGDVTVLQTALPTTVLVPITVVSTGGSQFGTNGNFNFVIDVVPTGNALQSGITFDATPVGGTSVFAAPSLNTGFNALFNIDGIVNSNTATNATLGATPTTVANLRFNVSAAVPVGTYAINFVTTGPANIQNSVTDSTLTAYTLNAANNGYSVANGSITISAVPEPSSLVLAGVAMGSVVGWRFRKRLGVRRT
jgi:hypothetical protein